MDGSTGSGPGYLGGDGEQMGEPSRLKPGDPVVLRRGLIPTHPVTTLVQIDDLARKAQIRFSRPPGTQGYSYLFWRDFADIEGGIDDGRTASEV